MRHITLALALLGILTMICCNDDSQDDVSSIDEEYFIIGQYFGRCVGDECGVFVKLEKNDLSKGNAERFLVDNTIPFESYVPKDENLKTKLEMLRDSMPPIMLANESRDTFGCPDCADAGVLYIEHVENETEKIWLLDNITNNNPKDIVDYAERVKILIEEL